MGATTASSIPWNLVKVDGGLSSWQQKANNRLPPEVNDTTRQDSEQQLPRFHPQLLGAAQDLEQHPGDPQHNSPAGSAVALATSRDPRDSWQI